MDNIIQKAAVEDETLKKEVVDQVRGPEDADFSRDGSADSLKRKLEREPESPGQADPIEDSVAPFAKKERTYYDEREHDSPASYPKHVMVPSQDQDDNMHDERKEGKGDMPAMHPGAPLLTPDSLPTKRREHFYDAEDYSRPQPFNDPYQPSPYHGGDDNRVASSAPRPDGTDAPPRPRRWACDFCNVATFLSYEEACGHEEVCKLAHQQPYRQHHSQPPQPQQQQPQPHQTPYGQQPHGVQSQHIMTSQQHQPPVPPPQQGSGLGALYHASQEVVTPPTPHRHQQGNRWGSRGPPLPVLPHEQGYYRQGYYDQREDPNAYYNRQDPYYPQYSGYTSYPQQQQHQQQPQYHHHHQHQQQQPHPQQPHHGSYYPQVQHSSHQPYQKRMLLAMPTDSDSLSDRQCYVRAEMCEIFAATEKDVAARHSKGAQKLAQGQVGIRCVFCSHLRPRDRAERAVCYPSSISRIYQTVADMQRFHFEHCREIPKHVQQVYRGLKTTRPRGVGSPQAYWVQSAKSMGLADTENGIRFDNEVAKEQKQQQQQQQPQTISDMSIGTS